MERDKIKEMNLSYKIVPNFFSATIALIVGGALVDQFSAENGTVENPVLAGLYLLVFAFSVGSMVKGSKKEEQ